MVSQDLVKFENRVMNTFKNTLRVIEQDGLIVTKYLPLNKRAHYYVEETKKERIVLHYTVGNTMSDFQQLTNGSKVSVAYLIAQSGQIIELFDPKYWAYHLGPEALGGNTMQSKKCIGIEISNYGWLERKGDKLYTAYGDIYCDIKDTDKYDDFSKNPFRVNVDPSKFKEGQYWSKFNDAQYNSIKLLLQYLSKRFNIPCQFLPSELRLEYTEKAINFNGIITHVNLRKDKWDIGPNFDWDKIV